MLVDHFQKQNKTKLKKEEIHDIYQNKPDKACLQHDMFMEIFKN